MHVRLRNERTGELKEIKVGWSWTLFLFSTVLGIPLFLRKLPMWGMAMLVLSVIHWTLNFFSMPDDGEPGVTGTDMLFFMLAFAMFGFTVFFGIKGNEITAKNLLENGWRFADQNNDAVTIAKAKWSLA